MKLVIESAFEFEIISQLSKFEDFPQAAPQFQN